MNNKYLVKTINKKTIKVVGEEVKSSQSKLPTLRELMFGIIKDVKIIKDDVSILKKDVSVLKQDVSVLKQDVSVLKQDVNAMKNTPTMKKELKISELF